MKPLYSEDGGHAMLFKTFAGELMLLFHVPHRFPDERAVFFMVDDKDYNLKLLSLR